MQNFCSFFFSFILFGHFLIHFLSNTLQYFLKTQRCKFGSKCKFNHPKVSSENADVSSGLPERPSEPPCAVSYLHFVLTWDFIYLFLTSFLYLCSSTWKLENVDMALLVNSITPRISRFSCLTTWVKMLHRHKQILWWVELQEIHSQLNLLYLRRCKIAKGFQ